MKIVVALAPPPNPEPAEERRLFVIKLTRGRLTHYENGVWTSSARALAFARTQIQHYLKLRLVPSIVGLPINPQPQ